MRDVIVLRVATRRERVALLGGVEQRQRSAGAGIASLQITSATGMTAQGNR